MVEHLWLHPRPGGGRRSWDRAGGLAVTASPHHDVTTYPTVGSPRGTMNHAEAPVRGKQAYRARSLSELRARPHLSGPTAPQRSRAIRSPLPFARRPRGDQSDASLGRHDPPRKPASRTLCPIDLPNPSDAQHVVEVVLGSLDAQRGLSANEQESRARQLSNLVSSALQQAIAQSDDLSAYGVESQAHQRPVVGATAPVVAGLDQALATEPERLAPRPPARSPPSAEGARAFPPAPTEID